ncbi:nuclear transport factor 2 family protein [Micromonospora aurantiaca]|uniref:nuclear transport factor 2 family protein n=1 Tax=Micromonospora aurantiaca (nom. illeg.) TaxID=47850 RepID=UPI0011A31401
MPLDTDQTAGATHTYARVQDFYARHMHLLDAGEAAEWAAMFTPDGVFVPPSAPEPIRGRQALEAGVRSAAAALADKGEQVRHLLTMAAVEPRADGVLFVRSYTQVVVTPQGGQPRLDIMCVCEDELVAAGDELLVRHRRVTRDDLP